MNSPIKRLDHVAVVNRELQGLEDAYTRMGFLLTPTSRHSGSLNAGAPVVPMGSGNRCAMFKEGYLELLCVVDPDLDHERIDVMLARHKGIHIMAFGCDDSPAAQHYLNAAGFNLPAPHLLERMAETSQGQQLLRFRNLRLTLEDMPEGNVIVIKHETPDLLWEPQLMDHPNGVVGLTEVVLCVADVEEATARYQRLLGVEPSRNGEIARFSVPRGRFVVVSPGALPEVAPGASAPNLPFPAAFTVSVENLAATEELFTETGVPCKKDSTRLTVPAEAGCGATVIFEQA
ncbi:MAG: VOC family protein [SAR324 cluster bacterium]|nr:VOC family protein [SAR324 cluster bacterium]